VRFSPDLCMFEFIASCLSAKTERRYGFGPWMVVLSILLCLKLPNLPGSSISPPVASACRPRSGRLSWPNRSPASESTEQRRLGNFPCKTPSFPNTALSDFITVRRTRMGDRWRRYRLEDAPPKTPCHRLGIAGS